MDKQLPSSELAKKVIVHLASLYETLKQAASVHSLSALSSAVGSVVMVVEQFSEEIKASGENKQDVAVAILNYFIDIPFLPEYFEDKVLRFAIDVVVTFLNERFGKSWLSKLQPVAPPVPPA